MRGAGRHRCSLGTLGGGADVTCVNALTLLPDGRLAAGQGNSRFDCVSRGDVTFDCVVRVWDLQHRTLDVVLTGHRGEVNTLAVLPDCRLLRSSYRMTLKVWDARALSLRGGVATAQCASTLWAPGGDSQMSLAVLPDGSVANGH